MWNGFHLDLEKLEVILQINIYPLKLIDKSVKRYLSKNINNMPSEKGPSNTKENIWYFKLSFIIFFLNSLEFKLQKLTKKFCEESTNNKIVFSTFKFFLAKDKVSYSLIFYAIC